MNTFSTWLTATMLVIFTVMVAIATTYPAGARFMPFIVGIPGMLLCMLQLVQDWLASHKTRLASHFHSAPRAGQHSLAEYPTAEHVAAEVELPEFGPHTVKDEVRIWAYFVAFIAGVLLFGFIVAVPIMVAVYLWRDGEVRLPYAVVIGLITIGIVHLMFERLLRFQLHPGFITEAVMRGTGF